MIVLKRQEECPKKPKQVQTRQNLELHLVNLLEFLIVTNWPSFTMKYHRFLGGIFLPKRSTNVGRNGAVRTRFGADKYLGDTWQIADYVG